MESAAARTDELPDSLAEVGGRAVRDLLVDSRPRLYRVALLLLGNREEAEDATQKCLLRALAGTSHFRGQAQVYTWAYRILVNVCKDVRKWHGRRNRWLVPDLPEAAADPRPTSEDVLLEQERARRLRQAMERLDDRQREVIVLRHFQEMSYEEIAAVLACPVGTVRSRLSSARERLRHEMNRVLRPDGGRGER